MQRKRSETSLGTMMRRHHLFAHKWRDRGYASCPKCFTVLKTCPICHQDMLMPKAQTRPDFLVAQHPAYVECKQAEERWPIDDFSANEENALGEAVEHDCSSWLFLEMGTGRAPIGKSAWLVPWFVFQGIRSRMRVAKLLSLRFEQKDKSRMPLASNILKGWELIWKHGGWTIPENHVWWTHFNLEDIKESNE